MGGRHRWDVKKIKKIFRNMIVYVWIKLIEKVVNAAAIGMFRSL